jgi:hypothetical protein
MEFPDFSAMMTARQFDARAKEQPDAVSRDSLGRRYMQVSLPGSRKLYWACRLPRSKRPASVSRSVWRDELVHRETVEFPDIGSTVLLSSGEQVSVKNIECRTDVTAVIAYIW